MPRDRQEDRRIDANNARSRWLMDFKAEFVRLRPHLENASKLLKTVSDGELARAGVESDPKAVARQYHEGSKEKR